MGALDEAFEVTHVEALDAELRNRGVRSEAIILLGLGHEFDVFSVVGDKVHEDVMQPAVDWLVRCGEERKSGVDDVVKFELNL